MAGSSCFRHPTGRRAGSDVCVEQGSTLSCFTDGFFIGQFSIERAGKNRKLALRGAGQNLALVPGVDLGAFIVLSSQDAENALFLLQAAPAKSCARQYALLGGNGVADGADRHSDQRDVEKE